MAAGTPEEARRTPQDLGGDGQDHSGGKRQPRDEPQKGIGREHETSSDAERQGDGQHGEQRAHQTQIDELSHGDFSLG